MFRKTSFLLIAFLLAFFYNAASQNSQVLYYMNLPQSHFLNPALRPSNSIYIGLPVLSGINVRVNNNFLNYSDIIVPGQTGDSAISFLHKDFDFKKFISGLGVNNYVQPDAIVQLFGLGISAGKDLYIFFDYNLRAEGNFTFPRELFDLEFSDFSQYIGKTFDLSALNVNARVYNEFGLGFSKNITPNFRIGLKGKYLTGIAAASVNTKTLSATINNDLSESFNADMMVNISGPLSVSLNADNQPENIAFYDSAFKSFKGIINNTLNTKNNGFGIDLGAVLKVTNNITISAAITDLGYIKWKNNITTLNGTSNFKMSGINLFDFYSGKVTVDSVKKEFLDSLKNNLKFTKSSTQFTTYLPAGVTVGGSFNITNSFSLGVISYTKFVEKKSQEAVTLSANLNLRNIFSASLAYTTANKRFDNFGFGIAVRAGWMQIYALADRIPVTWKKVGNSTPVPANWNTVHAMAGINLDFGNKIKKKNDKPMVVVQQ